MPGLYAATGMCELAQAGHRNHHKTIDEMQRANLFSLACELGDS